MIPFFKIGTKDINAISKVPATDKVKIEVTNFDDEQQKNNVNDDQDSGPTSLHLSSIICSEHHSSNEATKTDPTPPVILDISKKLVPIEVVEKLRSELMSLKDWKSKATQEIVDRDRALGTDMGNLIRTLIVL